MDVIYKEMTPVPLTKRHRKELLEVNLYTNVLKNFLIVPKGFRVIGTIRRGMNMGLLARDPEGQFVRINGSYVEPLDESSTRTVVNYLRAGERSASLARQTCASAPADFSSYVRNSATVPLPVQVTVRKRRHIKLPGGDSPAQYEGIPMPHNSPPLTLLHAEDSYSRTDR